MRLAGLILVVLGALALGYEGFVHVTQDAAGRLRTVWVPPVVAGIALVSGLILLVISTRREAGV